MLSLIRRYETQNIITALKIMKLSSSSSASIDDDIEFRVLELMPSEQKATKKRSQTKVNLMNKTKNEVLTNQDWQAIWPAARTFHPDIVPFTLQQGYKNKKGIHPDKYANAELLKIPNFLHLTPPVIERHCRAIKKFCTKWPKELKTDETCVKYFPVEIITSDYCYSSPTIREPLARIVNLRVRLSSLHLDAHAKDKILRLLGNRYNPNTDIITITADRCPSRKQNLDYVNYLLTALFHVSWRFEPWETEKSEVDMEYYDWDKSKSRKSLTSMYSWPKMPTDSNYEYIPHATEYKIAVSDLINKGEDQFSINKYKQAVRNVLNLKSYDFKNK
ncbi:28S ribosomal protein S35, mitochondrial isoform X1 [Bombus terrestris]|uniref:28S ribosomal protein S35, mitochondrial isoform X1 n=1 Tax=Bombus terrestris TaxID=30195 RepID=A0A9B0F4C3_BOMTE|nr:28S ribosomal protein S35, mitochondrial isoform X1 [Bombus terrestris]